MTEPHSPEGITSHPTHADPAIAAAPAHGHEAGHGHAPPLPFAEGDWQEFRENDKGAARVIVLLMTGIFLTGLALYSVIAVVCGS